MILVNGQPMDLDDMSDGDYCDHVFGYNFSELLPDDYIPESEDKSGFFYLFNTDGRCKFGISKTNEGVLKRLEERVRQCGKTTITHLYEGVDYKEYERQIKAHVKQLEEYFDLPGFIVSNEVFDWRALDGNIHLVDNFLNDLQGLQSHYKVMIDVKQGCRFAVTRNFEDELKSGDFYGY